MPPIPSNAEWVVLVIKVQGGMLTASHAEPRGSLKACYSHARTLVATQRDVTLEFHWRPKGATDWTRHSGYILEEARVKPGEACTISMVPFGHLVTDATYLWEVIRISEMDPTVPYKDAPMLRCFRQCPPPPGLKRTDYKFIQGDCVHGLGPPFIYVGTKEKGDAILAEMHKEIAVAQPDIDAGKVRLPRPVKSTGGGGNRLLPDLTTQTRFFNAPPSVLSLTPDESIPAPAEPAQ